MYFPMCLRRFLTYTFLLNMYMLGYEHEIAYIAVYGTAVKA